MRFHLAALFALIAAPVFAQPPIIPFDATDPLKMPADMHLGEAAGVSVNAAGDIFVFTRANTDGPAYGGRAAQLLQFDRNGNFTRELGRNLYAWGFAHTVKIDRENNIWAVDKGTDMVVKFNPQGRVTMVFGRKPEASDETAHPLEHPNPPLPPVDGYFRQVTDIAWDSQGNSYVSDGYVNSRIAKYDRNGNWVMSWGTPGAGPSQFSTPHAIALDAADNVYVADRNNRRIQVFDTSGRFLREMRIGLPYDANARPVIGNRAMPDGNGGFTGVTPQHMPGAPWTVCITPGPNQVLYTSDAFPGRIYKMSLDGRLLGVLGEAGRQPKQFGWIHEIACPSENELYVAEIINWRVQKLTLRPGR